ncbi:MAG TPA: hypothetical protein VL306_02790 [Methylomirabilota bacterium]|jgi:hypothetical protein|nr:hypothetical protein [Methylomirabilota bacterium]
MKALKQVFEGEGFSLQKTGSIEFQKGSPPALSQQEIEALERELQLGERSPEEVAAIWNLCEQRLSDGLPAQRRIGFRTTPDRSSGYPEELKDRFQPERRRYE